MKPTVEQPTIAETLAWAEQEHNGLAKFHDDRAAFMRTAVTTLRRYVALEAAVGEYFAAHDEWEAIQASHEETHEHYDLCNERITNAYDALRSIHEQGKAE